MRCLRRSLVPLAVAVSLIAATASAQTAAVSRPPTAAALEVTTPQQFDSKTPLRSGWAWGQHYLEGGAAAVDAQVGKGKVFLIGPEITFRAQPHGTFKFLFNAIYYGSSQIVGGW